MNVLTSSYEKQLIQIFVAAVNNDDGACSYENALMILSCSDYWTHSTPDTSDNACKVEKCL